MPDETLTISLSIMGRPVLLSAPGPALLETVAAAYAGWPTATEADGPPVTLDLLLADAAGSFPANIAVDGPHLRLSAAGIDGWADARTLGARCTVPRSLIGQPARLAEELTDTLLLFLLTRSGCVPLHAAGVVCGTTALLLAGPSGSGKSTLTLAAMARGLRILSDDTVYIQLQPRLRIWGFPRPAHVFPADAPGFIQATRLRGGKLKAAIPVPFGTEPPAADQAAVVLLERGTEIRIEAIEPGVAEAALSRLEPGFDLLARESAAAAAAVCAQGAWRLTLGRDPDQAMDVLVRKFGTARSQSA